MLMPGEVIETALAGGVITPADVVDRTVSVDLVGRSHPVYRLSLDNLPIAFIKSFGPSRGASDGRLEREQAIGMLAALRPEVAAVIPPILGWNGRRDVIATQAVVGIAMGEMPPAPDAATRLAEWSSFVHAIAAPLAAFHRATRDLAKQGAAVPMDLRGERPWVLDLFDGDGANDIWSSPALGRLLQRAALHRTTVKGIRAARAAWREMCVIHCDLKHDNVLMSGEQGALRPVFVDWEMARLGDPAWDVAALAARPVMIDQGSDCWSDANLGAVTELIRAYAVASTLSPPALARRTLLYMGAWLLMAAIQYRSTLPDAGDDSASDGLMASCHATFDGLDALTGNILDRLA